jgi:hypothetical protein
MKRLSGWDTYVKEAMKDGDRSVELPLTPDESYIIKYPTRRQGRQIARAQVAGDTDALLVAMLGEEAGNRVKELSEDLPAFVLDEFLMDVMRKFGMVPDDGTFPGDDETSEPETEEPEEGAKVVPVAPKGKAGSVKKSTTSSKPSSAESA